MSKFAVPVVIGLVIGLGVGFGVGFGAGFWATSRPYNNLLQVSSYQCIDKDLVVSVPAGFVGRVYAQAYEEGDPAPEFPTSDADSKDGTGQTSVTLAMTVSEEKLTNIRVWALQKHTDAQFDCRTLKK